MNRGIMLKAAYELWPATLLCGLLLLGLEMVLAYLMPQVSFLTWLDVFMLGSSALVFCALIEAVVTTQLSVRGNDALAIVGVAL